MPMPRLRSKCFKVPLSIIFIIVILYINYFYNDISEQLKNTKDVIRAPQLKLQYSVRKYVKWKMTENSTNQNAIKKSTNKNANKKSTNHNAIKLNSTNQKQRPVYVLWSRWRRGSSFVGKLLAYAKSKTFYR